MNHKINLIIDNTPIQADLGITVLEAARRAGIEIPTLCHRDDMPPLTSCFICAVRVTGHDALQPACALIAEEGMLVTAHSDEILQARRTALELLLSDHAGRCVAPCAIGCPAHLDIPAFLEPLARGDMNEAMRIVRQHLALPAILGRVCHAFCESACLRKNVDKPVSIRLLHRMLADADLASPEHSIPAKSPATGKRIAIVGAGPAGLTAAWFLLLAGHAVTVFDAAQEAGGLLRKIPTEQLDTKTIDAEVAVIRNAGAVFHLNWQLGKNAALDQLRKEFDAVLLATGGAWSDSIEKRTANHAFLKSLGLDPDAQGKFADPHTHATSLPQVFAAGETTTGTTSVIRAAAAGHDAAISIGQFLSGKQLTRPSKPLYFSHKMTKEEQARLYSTIAKSSNFGSSNLKSDSPNLTPDREPSFEASRCMQCSCLKRNDCRLRDYASQYNANPNRFTGERRATEPDLSHPTVAFDPGKCILCGLCVEISGKEDAAKGLAFAGRGFPTRIVTPLASNLSDSLTDTARRCAQACPTAAIALHNNTG